MTFSNARGICTPSVSDRSRAASCAFFSSDVTVRKARCAWPGTLSNDSLILFTPWTTPLSSTMTSIWIAVAIVYFSSDLHALQRMAYLSFVAPHFEHFG
jgi:hypothetical protein